MDHCYHLRKFPQLYFLRAGIINLFINVLGCFRSPCPFFRLFLLKLFTRPLKWYNCVCVCVCKWWIERDEEDGAKWLCSTLISLGAGCRQAGIEEFRNFCRLCESQLFLDLEVGFALGFLIDGDHVSKSSRAEPDNIQVLCLYKFTHPCFWICGSENTILYLWYLSSGTPSGSHLSRAECWWGKSDQFHSATKCRRDWSWILWLSVVWRHTLLNTHLSAPSLRNSAVGLDISNHRPVSKSCSTSAGVPQMHSQGHSRIF